MNMVSAINSALDVMMSRDPDILIFGQDVGYFGGVFRATDGLQAKHGAKRCFDAPISEGGIVATAIGMGAYGLRPVVEIQFADYMPEPIKSPPEADSIRHLRPIESATRGR